MSTLIDQAKELFTSTNSRLKEITKEKVILTERFERLTQIICQVEWIQEKKEEEIQLLEELAGILNQIPKETK